MMSLDNTVTNRARDPQTWKVSGPPEESDHANLLFDEEATWPHLADPLLSYYNFFYFVYVLLG